MIPPDGRRTGARGVRPRRVMQRGVALGALVAGLLAPLAVPAAAAAAESDGILISFDGTTYSSTPEGSVFPAGVALTPGSALSGTVHVLNNSSQAGELRIAVSGSTAGTTTFVESLSMRADTPATPNGVTVPLRVGESCSPLLAGEVLGPGRSTRVAITLMMDPTVGNAAQSSSADARLHVSLHQPGVAAGEVTSNCPPGNGIPVTGEPGDPSGGGDAGEPGDVGGGAGGTGRPTPALSPDPASPDPETSATASPTADPAAPAVETPPTAGLPPTGSFAAGSSVDGALFPWIGVGALVAGAAAFVVGVLRKRRLE